VVIAGPDLDQPPNILYETTSTAAADLAIQRRYYGSPRCQASYSQVFNGPAAEGTL